MKKLALLLSVLTIVLFSACGDQTEEATETPDQTPVEDTEEAAIVEVTITNGLEALNINFIYINAAGESSDPGRLGGDILAPGESLTVEVEEGLYDFMVMDETHEYYSFFNVEIGPDAYQWNVTLDDRD